VQRGRARAGSHVARLQDTAALKKIKMKNVYIKVAPQGGPHIRVRWVKTLKQPGLDIIQTFNQVGLAVKRATGVSQQPWVSSSPIDGSFYFVLATPDGPSAAVTPPSAAIVPQGDVARPAPGAAPVSRETNELDSKGETAFDGRWAYTGEGTNCLGSGLGTIVISGGVVISSKNGRGVGRVEPNGSYRATSIGADGVRLTATGKMSGNNGSGTYRRADGCSGRWAAKKL
jgi:hypothetical protein